MKFEFYRGRVDERDLLRDLVQSIQLAEIKNLQCLTLDADNNQESDFKLETHRILWHYWQTLRGRNDIAVYDAIDPAAFNKAIGNVLLLEPKDDRSDFKYRVYGSSVANSFGAEMTGKYVSEFPGEQKKLSLAQYPKTLELRRPIYSEHHTSVHDYKTTRWCRLILPMQHRESGTLNRILVGVVPVDQDAN